MYMTNADLTVHKVPHRVTILPTEHRNIFSLFCDPTYVFW